MKLPWVRFGETPVPVPGAMAPKGSCELAWGAPPGGPPGNEGYIGSIGWETGVRV